MFSSAAGDGRAGTGPEQPGQRPNAEHVFGDVFEDVRCLLLCLLKGRRGHTATFLTYLLPFQPASTAGS